ncbi:hypothetical protein BDR26DRAFT_901749 [Obelidium mucronatum]|nr:hypothetical protein BDR26DRAFT_901749 [Obelidium mucronatum]
MNPVLQLLASGSALEEDDDLEVEPVQSVVPVRKRAVAKPMAPVKTPIKKAATAKQPPKRMAPKSLESRLKKMKKEDLVKYIFENKEPEIEEIHESPSKKQRLFWIFQKCKSNSQKSVVYQKMADEVNLTATGGDLKNQLVLGEHVKTKLISLRKEHSLICGQIQQTGNCFCHCEESECECEAESDLPEYWEELKEYCEGEAGGAHISYGDSQAIDDDNKAGRDSNVLEDHAFDDNNNENDGDHEDNSDGDGETSYNRGSSSEAIAAMTRKQALKQLQVSYDCQSRSSASKKPTSAESIESIGRSMDSAVTKLSESIVRAAEISKAPETSTTTSAVQSTLEAILQRLDKGAKAQKQQAEINELLLQRLRSG